MSDEQRLGRYIIEEELGEGSFAWVYRGYDEELDRRVAIKLLKPMWMADMNAVTRFKQEARTMAKLEHPNIAVVYEVGEEQGQVFLAQRLVDGDTLGARLEESVPMPWDAALHILRQIGSALDYAHENQMIHRDIKPANILVDKTDRAFLGDFGLVRAAEGSASISASTGGMVGTPAYMAPEQWEGKDISPATDVYALSCVVFEMVTGRMLFNGETPATVMKQHLMEGPKFPDEWPSDVPPKIAEVLTRGLAENSAERIQTAGGLVAELEKISEADTAMMGLPWLLAADEQKHILKPGSTTLGRGKNADIQIDRAMISRQHATLDFDGQQVTVYDENSANGTFVNNERLGAEGRILEFGDTLRVGDVNFTLGAPDVEVAAPAAAPVETEAAHPIGATAQTVMGADSDDLAAVRAEIETERQVVVEAEPAPPIVTEPEPESVSVSEPEQVAEVQAEVETPPQLEPTPEQESVPTAATPPKKKGSRLPLIIGGVIALLVVAGLCGVFILFSSDDGGDTSSEPVDSGVVAAVDEEEPEESPTNTPRPPTPTPEPEEPDQEEEPVVELEEETVVEETTTDADEILRQAEALFNEGQFEQAIPLLDQAVELDPENVGIYDMRGYSHFNLGNNDEAIANFDQSLSLAPDDPYIYNFRGLAYLNIGDPEKARADFDQAIKLNPEDGDFYYNMGYAIDLIGDNPEDALASYIEAVTRYDAAGIGADYPPYEESVARVAALEEELGSGADVTESEPTETPTEAPAAEEEPAPVAVSVSGHIAVPLMVGGEPQVQIVDTDGNLVNTLESARQPSHTEDGSELVVNGDGGGQILLRWANSDGDDAEEFGDSNFNAHSFPTISPDGELAAYLDRFGTQEYHMFFRPIDNSGGEGEEFFAGGPIFHSNPMYPQWGSEGIFFRGCSTWNGQGGNCGTWLLSGQQGTVDSITDEVNHIPTDVSGTTGIVSWNQGGNWDVYAVNLSSGSITQLTDDPAQDALGTLSPDGKSVAFLSNRGGGLAVWRVGITGGEAEKLFDIQPDWGQLRNDGWSEETLSWGK